MYSPLGMYKRHERFSYSPSSNPCTDSDSMKHGSEDQLFDSPKHMMKEILRLRDELNKIQIAHKDIKTSTSTTSSILTSNEFIKGMLVAGVAIIAVLAIEALLKSKNVRGASNLQTSITQIPMDSISINGRVYIPLP